LSKQSLIIVSPGFPKDESESTCLPYIQMFIKALQKAYPNLQISIVSLQYPFYSKTYNWHSCKVIACGGKNKKSNRLVTWYKAKRAIRSIIKTENVIGIVSMWLTECTYISQNIAAKNNIPLVAWSWGQDVKRENKYIKLLKFNLFKTAVVSASSRDLLFSNHGKKSDIILNNGIDVYSIPAMKNIERDVDILCVGSLNDFKRFDWLVDVVISLNNKNIKAVIIGDGPERITIEKKISSAGLQSQIQMLGQLSHMQALSWMNRSKILLHPSSFEGASTVILEALYYGCTVVSVTVPSENMPDTFFAVSSKEEMINTTNKLMINLPLNQSVLVNSCTNTSNQLIELIEPKI